MNLRPVLLLAVLCGAIQGAGNVKQAKKISTYIPRFVFASFVGLGLLGFFASLDLGGGERLSQHLARSKIEFEFWLTGDGPVAERLQAWQAESGFLWCESADLCIRRGIRHQLNGRKKVAAKFFQQANFLNRWTLLDWNPGEAGNWPLVSTTVWLEEGPIYWQTVAANQWYFEGITEAYLEIKSVGLKTTDLKQWAALVGCYRTPSKQVTSECLQAVKSVMNPAE